MATGSKFPDVVTPRPKFHHSVAPFSQSSASPRVTALDNRTSHLLFHSKNLTNSMCQDGGTDTSNNNSFTNNIGSDENDNLNVARNKMLLNLILKTATTKLPEPEEKDIVESTPTRMTKLFSVFRTHRHKTYDTCYPANERQRYATKPSVENALKARLKLAKKLKAEKETTEDEEFKRECDLDLKRRLRDGFGVHAAEPKKGPRKDSEPVAKKSRATVLTRGQVPAKNDTPSGDRVVGVTVMLDGVEHNEEHACVDPEGATSREDRIAKTKAGLRLDLTKLSRPNVCSDSNRPNVCSDSNRPITRNHVQIQGSGYCFDHSVSLTKSPTRKCNCAHIPNRVVPDKGGSASSNESRPRETVLKPGPVDLGDSIRSVVFYQNRFVVTKKSKPVTVSSAPLNTGPIEGRRFVSLRDSGQRINHLLTPGKPSQNQGGGPLDQEINSGYYGVVGTMEGGEKKMHSGDEVSSMKAVEIGLGKENPIKALGNLSETFAEFSGDDAGYSAKHSHTHRLHDCEYNENISKTGHLLNETVGTHIHSDDPFPIHGDRSSTEAGHRMSLHSCTHPKVLVMKSGIDTCTQAPWVGGSIVDSGISPGCVPSPQRHRVYESHEPTSHSLIHTSPQRPHDSPLELIQVSDLVHPPDANLINGKQDDGHIETLTGPTPGASAYSVDQFGTSTVESVNNSSEIPTWNGTDWPRYQEFEKRGPPVDGSNQRGSFSGRNTYFIASNRRYLGQLESALLDINKVSLPENDVQDGLGQVSHDEGDLSASAQHRKSTVVKKHAGRFRNVASDLLNYDDGRPRVENVNVETGQNGDLQCSATFRDKGEHCRTGGARLRGEVFGQQGVANERKIVGYNNDVRDRVETAHLIALQHEEFLGGTFLSDMPLGNGNKIFKETGENRSIKEKPCSTTGNPVSINHKHHLKSASPEVPSNLSLPDPPLLCTCNRAMGADRENPTCSELISSCEPPASARTEPTPDIASTAKPRFGMKHKQPHAGRTSRQTTGDGGRRGDARNIITAGSSARAGVTGRTCGSRTRQEANTEPGHVPGYDETSPTPVSTRATRALSRRNEGSSSAAPQQKRGPHPDVARFAPLYSSDATPTPEENVSVPAAPSPPTVTTTKHCHNTNPRPGSPLSPTPTNPFKQAQVAAHGKHVNVDLSGIEQPTGTRTHGDEGGGKTRVKRHLLFRPIVHESGKSVPERGPLGSPLLEDPSKTRQNRLTVGHDCTSLERNVQTDPRRTREINIGEDGKAQKPRPHSHETLREHDGPRNSCSTTRTNATGKSRRRHEQVERGDTCTPTTVDDKCARALVECRALVDTANDVQSAPGVPRSIQGLNASSVARLSPGLVGAFVHSQDVATGWDGQSADAAHLSQGLHSASVGVQSCFDECAIPVGAERINSLYVDIPVFRSSSLEFSERSPEVTINDGHQVKSIIKKSLINFKERKSQGGSLTGESSLLSWDSVLDIHLENPVNIDSNHEIKGTHNSHPEYSQKTIQFPRVVNHVTFSISTKDNAPVKVKRNPKPDVVFQPRVKGQGHFATKSATRPQPPLLANNRFGSPKPDHTPETTPLLVEADADTMDGRGIEIIVSDENDARVSTVHSGKRAVLRRIWMVLLDNRVAGRPDTERALRPHHEEYRVLKRVLNIIFITIGVALLVSVFVVIIYTYVVDEDDLRGEDESRTYPKATPTPLLQVDQSTLPHS